ncbi:MAG: type II toxin-antitoxin system HicA family toxin [Turicibacter sp.]|nr:type II toxin-antitoxin system HicA family toxin [Turicibacter sp.]
MASVEKIVDKMKRQPHGVRYEEAKKVLEHNGYKATSQKGSHRTFRNAVGGSITVVEEKPAIKQYHVNAILQIITD